MHGLKDLQSRASSREQLHQAKAATLLINHQRATMRQNSTASHQEEKTKMVQRQRHQKDRWATRLASIPISQAQMVLV